MAILHQTKNYKISSFNHGQYFTIEDLNSNEDTMLQDEDASVFQVELDNAHTEANLDAICSQYL